TLIFSGRASATVGCAVALDAAPLGAETAGTAGVAGPGAVCRLLWQAAPSAPAATTAAPCSTARRVRRGADSSRGLTSHLQRPVAHEATGSRTEIPRRIEP